MLFPLAVAVLAVSAVACHDSEMVSPPTVNSPAFAKAAASPTADLISAQMDAVNAALAAQGADIRVMMAEYIAGGDEVGAQVLQKDLGNKRLGADFVPNDPRRTWSGPPGGSTDNITYAIDQVDATPLSPGVTAAETNAAIMAAMATWDAQACSDLGLAKVSDGGFDLGVVAALNGLGGSFVVAADVQHAGFRDINFAGGVIGATYTFVFVDANVPTDIDSNGRADVAFREIYYDPSWFWTVGNLPGIDVESIALHEAGHALSQAHFGNIFLKKGELSASPRAVMNAFYPGGEQRSLLGTDRGGHCGNWAQWPQN